MPADLVATRRAIESYIGVVESPTLTSETESMTSWTYYWI